MHYQLFNPICYKVSACRKVERNRQTDNTRRHAYNICMHSYRLVITSSCCLSMIKLFTGRGTFRYAFIIVYPRTLSLAPQMILNHAPPHIDVVLHFLMDFTIDFTRPPLVAACIALYLLYNCTAPISQITGFSQYRN